MEGLPATPMSQAVFEALPDVAKGMRISLNMFGPGNLYAAGSFYSHACMPNAMPIPIDDFEGLRVIMTSKPVAKGAEITLSYLDNNALSTMSTLERQMFLFNRWGFWCRCARCEGQEKEPYEEADYHSEDLGRVIDLLQKSGVDLIPVLDAEANKKLRAEQQSALTMFQAAPALLLLLLLLLRRAV
eukprot:TRINITY_DN36224_c0_g1_i2.p2 TRINITY_DN36224_c0_g1~~TRINITY_DN36224_c0_g1_i2.p2  ORF type:complete len:186 (+),score=35.35 TRINITY_DN36224_c0_g1_i2:846-1403(+)